MHEKLKGIASQPHYVYWHDTDKNGHMNFAAIARCLQETAWQSAEQLGYGFEAAKEMNRIWGLIRQWIKMEKFPNWKDTIIIETWPRGVDGFWAFRDYYIKNDKGEILGGATSSWMLINTQTRRPEKLYLTEETQPYMVSRLALEDSAPKIEYAGQNKMKDVHTVRFSDMDMHGHVNNSRYIEWIYDALSAFGFNKSYTSFQINHQAETVENDQLDLSVSKIENSVFVKAEKRSDQRGVFIARLDV